MPNGLFDIDAAQRGITVAEELSKQSAKRVDDYKRQLEKNLSDFKKSKIVADLEDEIKTLKMVQDVEISNKRKLLADDKTSASQRKQLASEIAALERKLAEDTGAKQVQIDELVEKEKEKNEQLLASEKLRIFSQLEKDRQRITEIADNNILQKSDIYTRKRYLQERAEEEKSHQDKLRNSILENDRILAYIETQYANKLINEDEYKELCNNNAANRADLQASLEQSIASQRALNLKKSENEILLLKAQSEAISKQAENINAENADAAEGLLKKYSEIKDAATQELGVLEAELLLHPEDTELQSKINELKDEVIAPLNIQLSGTDGSGNVDNSSLAVAAAVKRLDQNEQKRHQEELQQQVELEARKQYYQTEEGKAALKKQSKKDLKDTTEALLKDLLKKMSDMMEDRMKSFYQYQSRVEARLQGSDESYRDLLGTVSRNIGISGVISQQKTIEKLVALADVGIAYNLELRAFLAGISEDIATTFDVFDSNLLRLIRLQQADTTAARLGLEASLTKLFNETFKDTSYLSDVFDTVSSALIDANSQMTRDMSIEFEYIVQKWLGSLYSLGMDSATISSIAQGINYLATGDVQNLTNNTSLMNLLAMSASRTGEDLGEILTEGLSPETTNTILYGIVDYLREIVANQSNTQVAKSALGDVFGFTMADLTAVKSLTSSEISSIYSSTLSYADSMRELSDQFTEVADRKHITNIIDTVLDNVISGAAQDIGISAATYLPWKIATLMTASETKGGSNIPTVLAGGFGVDLGGSVADLLYGVATVVPIATSLMSAGFSGNLFGSYDLKGDWNYEEFLRKSSGLSSRGRSGKNTSLSDSLNITRNSSWNDVEDQTLSDAADAAELDENIVNQHVKGGETTTYDALVTEDTDVVTEVISINERLDKYLDFGRVFLTSGGGSGGGTSSSSGELIGTESSSGSSSSSHSYYPNGTPTVNPESSVSGNGSNTGLENLDQTIQDSNSLLVEELTGVSEYLQTALAVDRIFLTQSSGSTNGSTNSVYKNNYDGNIDYFSSWNQMYSNINWLNQLSQESQEVQETISKLENLVTEKDLETITSLVTATSVAASMASFNNDASKDNQQQVKVVVDHMSPEVSTYIASMVKSMMSSALLGADSNSSLIEEMKKLLSDTEMSVQVKNDDFDTALRKVTYSY